MSTTPDKPGATPDGRSLPVRGQALGNGRNLPGLIRDELWPNRSQFLPRFVAGYGSALIGLVLLAFALRALPIALSSHDPYDVTYTEGAAWVRRVLLLIVGGVLLVSIGVAVVYPCLRKWSDRITIRDGGIEYHQRGAAESIPWDRVTSIAVRDGPRPPVYWVCCQDGKEIRFDGTPEVMARLGEQLQRVAAERGIPYRTVEVSPGA